MVSTLIEALRQLQQDYSKGEYYKVFHTISLLQSKDGLALTQKNNSDEVVNIFYLKLSSLFKLNFINDLLSEMNTYLEVIFLSPISKLKFLVVYLQALLEIGNFNQAMQIVKQADFELKNINFNLPPNDEKIIGLYFHSKGTLFYYRADFDQAIHYLKKALLIRENYQDTQNISDTINNMGMVYQAIGEFELATKCYLECISLDQSMKYEKGIAYSLNNLGFISLQTGDLEEAYSYFVQAYELVRKLSNITEIPEVVGNINFKLLDIILLNIEDYKFVGELFSNLGNNLNKLDDITGSLFYYTKALYVYKKTNNVALLSDLYIQLITINLEIENVKEAKKYLVELDQLNASESKTIQLRSNFAHALLNYNNKRFEGKYKAQKTFYEIVNAEILDWNVSIKTMTILSESLIEEFMIFENPEIITEAKAILDKMHTIAKDKKSFSLLVESFILKMKFLVIEGNLDKALLYLDQAYFTSLEKNLVTLITKVNTERARLEKDLQYWKDFVKNSSIKERFEKIEMMDYMNKIKNALTPFKD